MIKLLNINLGKIYLNSFKIIDNELYMLYNTVETVYYDGVAYHHSRLYLMKINLITKSRINIYITTEEYEYIRKSKIINDNIYVFKQNYIRVYDLDFNLIKNINICSKFVFMNNNNIYFLTYRESNYWKDLIYNICDEYNNIYLKIKFNCSEDKVVDESNLVKLELIFDIKYIKIFYYNNYVIFLDNRIIIYNMETREILKYNDIILNLNKYTFIGEINKQKYVIDVIKNESQLLTKYLKGVEKYIDLDKNIYDFDDIFEINDKYYIIFNYNVNNLSLYYNHKSINYENNNTIKIGTINKNIDIPLNLLENSEFIKNMIGDLNLNSEIIHSSLEDIDLYYKFIKNEEINNNELYKLFSICNFLIDKNINIVSMMIIEYIEFSEVEISEAFLFLKLFSNSIYDNSIKLLYIILEKYDIDKIFINFEKIDKNTNLYNMCIKELLKCSIKNIKDNLD